MKTRFTELLGVEHPIIRSEEVGAWSCGSVVGLIHDIPAVRELIDRIMADAEHIIQTRLRNFYQARRPNRLRFGLLKRR